MQPTMVLISPPALADRFTLHFPTNLTVISGALKQAGFGVKIIDLNLEAAREATPFFDDPLNYTLQIIENHVDSIDFFGLTTICSNYPFILQLASALKKRYHKPIIFGGAQATMTAARSMELFPYIDFIVAHEGEITIVKLLKAVSEGTDLKNVKGIFYRRNGNVFSTPFRPFIENLDDSPFPDFSAVDIKAYQEIYPNVRIPVDIGRGCPFKCTFCSTAMMWKRSFRMKSPQRAVAEMDALHNQFGVNWFFLTQDNLTTKKSYVQEFCAALRGKNYTWDCYSRCDTLDDEMLTVMVAAGCRHVFFGIESGSEEFQKVIKKNLRLANAEKAINACVKQGVDFTTAYIIGFPDEDRADISATLKSCFRDAARNARSIIFSVLGPLPGTEVVAQYPDRLTSPLAIQPDFSPFLLKNKPAAEAVKLIETYPDVFSSFYFLKPFHFELTELFEIRKFFYVLIDEFPRTTHLLLQYSTVQSLDLLDFCRKRGFPFDLKGVDSDAMAQFYMEIIEPHHAELGEKLLLIKEVLKYELAIYRLRTTPTPQGLLESQRHAATLDAEKIEPELLSFSSSLLSRSFNVDIHKVLESLPFEDHRYELLKIPLEIILYEDALNSDIVQERVDAETKKLLDNLQQNHFKNIQNLSTQQLLDFIRKGIMIYRKR